MARRKLHRYTGNEVASQPSIAEQLLRGTKIGNWLYGESKTYTDGNNAKRQDATFKESANGQMVQRMGETAKDAGSLALTGLAFGNPLTTSNAMAPLITGSQAYWIGHGINDGAQRIENIEEGVKNFVEDPSWQNTKEVAEEVPWLALDVAGAVPVARTVATTAEQVMPTVRNAANKASNYLKKQYASYEGAKIINSEVNQFPKQKWMLDQYNDHDFIFNEFSNPNSVVHVTPNPIVGKNVTEKASHVAGTSLVPGSAERSLVEGQNMIWLWDGKPYRAQWNDQTFISIPKTNRMTQTRQNRAVGIPEIDLTAPTTKIITRNPLIGGFERQIVVSEPEPITPIIFMKDLLN